jgi:hypothetical protein
MKCQFALHFIRVLNNHEARNHSRFTFTNVIRRMRGRLTFMLAAAADATATPAPGRLTGLRMVSHGGPFTSARTRRTSQDGFHAIHAFWLADDSGARTSGEKVSGLDGGRLPRPRRCRSSRGRTRTAFAVAFLVSEVGQCGTHPRLSQSGHLRSCLAPSIRTVRPAPVTDSPALPPLHSVE